MAKQTFTTGQVLTASQMTSLQQTALLGGAASAKVASYTLVAADAGTAISMTNASSTTITVDTGLFASGDIVTIVNLGAGTCTVTAGTATINTSANLALGQYEGGVLYFTSASAAIFFEFSSTSTGDITGVTAGTGISGGGTTGTVTVTNSMATEITAKADLIVGTGNATFDNLAVGANNTVLTADSSTATGLKWATPSASFKGCAVYKSTNQTIANNTETVVTFDTEYFDTNSYHSVSTNTGRMTVADTGYYQVNATLVFRGNSGSSTSRFSYLRKNGSTMLCAPWVEGTTNTMGTFLALPTIVYLAANDYIQLSVLQLSGLNQDLWANGGEPNCTFSISYLGA